MLTCWFISKSTCYQLFTIKVSNVIIWSPNRQPTKGKLQSFIKIDVSCKIISCSITFSALAAMNHALINYSMTLKSFVIDKNKQEKKKQPHMAEVSAAIKYAHNNLNFRCKISKIHDYFMTTRAIPQKMLTFPENCRVWAKVAASKSIKATHFNEHYAFTCFHVVEELFFARKTEVPQFLNDSLVKHLINTTKTAWLLSRADSFW